MEAVDEEELELLGHLYESRHQTVEHKEYYHERDKQREQRLEQVHVFVFSVSEYEHNRGNAEEVEKVYGDADAYDVGDQDEPAVGVRAVGLIFPLEYQPEDEGGAE